ncbi:MAG TPA: C45 family peptidase [Myxococcota bacterium]|nr:C45 family peptidase [Myxococcota bacterium]
MDSTFKIIIVVLLGLAVSLVGISRCNSAPAYQEASIEHGSLKRQGGTWVLRLSGSAPERGEAAGKLVGEQIRWLLPRYLKASLGREKLPAGAAGLLSKYEKVIPEDYLAQLGALARSAGVDRDSLLAVNLAPEMFVAKGCSCLALEAGRTSGGKVLLGRNLDWQAGEYLTSLGLLVIEKGSGHAFASVTWPGLVGVVSGMNERGLSVANLVVFGEGGAAGAGMPVLFILRKVLEQADDAAGAAGMIRDLRRSVCQNYALADAESARVVESCPDSVRIRSPKDGVLAVANRRNEDKHSGANSRYAKMIRAASAGKLDLEKLEAVLSQVALGKMNVQAVIFEPQGRVLHLSISEVPAASGTWTSLPLEFQ